MRVPIKWQHWNFQRCMEYSWRLTIGLRFLERKDYEI